MWGARQSLGGVVSKSGSGFACDFSAGYQPPVNARGRRERVVVGGLRQEVMPRTRRRDGAPEKAPM